MFKERLRRLALKPCARDFAGGEQTARGFVDISTQLRSHQSSIDVWSEPLMSKKFTPMDITLYGSLKEALRDLVHASEPHSVSR
jgi:hypothetical protein